MGKEQTNSEDHLFRHYGGVLGTEISPLSVYTARYFEKNYGESLKSIRQESRILEIGAGNASFVQYLLYKGYRDITVCEAADDNAESVDRFLGNRIEVIHSEANCYLAGDPGKFDLIYAGQVIEHFDYENFIEFLKSCLNSLNTGGYLILETINCANLTHGLYLRYCDYTHRMGFTPRSLMQFLSAIGDFTAIAAIEIHPPGLMDCIYYGFQKIRRRHLIPNMGRRESFAEKSGASRKLMKTLLKALSIRVSRCLSSLLLKHYEFDGLRIYTPFFAVVARK